MYIMLLEFIFKLLLACGLLFGGLYFVRVYQQISNSPKFFKVTDKNRAQTVLLPYFSFESFTEKCRAKFNFGNNEKLLFASGEDEEIEVDDEYLDHLRDKSLLIVKGERDASGHNDNDDGGDNISNDDDDDDYISYDDDDDDDDTGFVVLGTDHNTVDTVVDNADIEKWETTRKGGGVRQHFHQYGLKGITDVLKQNVNDWKSKPLNIAVTGESGKGKSSFINAFRGLSGGDIDAAEIDEVECTLDCRAFRHPMYDSFVIWDVPGVGTNTFPADTYLDKIQIDRYDFFMIVSSTRFTELETWLAKQVMAKKKKFYFIRTKIDIDMESKKRRFKKKFNENVQFKDMKAKINIKLCDALNVDGLHFFMISNHHPDKYDFPLILDQLLKDVPAEKKETMVFGLTAMSENFLEEKASALKSRIWKVALLSGVGAGIPVPFISAGIDTVLILEEVLFYRKQFGLDDESLKHLADMAGIQLEQLKSSIKFRTPQTLFTKAGLTRYLTKYVTREVGETVVKYTIPVFGVAISCGLSYSTTMGILEKLLDIMKQDALKVLVYVTTRTGTPI